MLILSPKKNQTIVIGTGPNQIIVMVTRIQGDKVRLGIAAPAEVPVVRSELKQEQ